MEHPIKSITVLGSTGSIGENALKVISNHDDRLEIFGLSAHKNAERLIQQAKKYKAKYVCIVDDSKYQEVTQALSGDNMTVLAGRNGLLELASIDESDLVLNAIVGAPGMEPTVAAITHGINVALSNKESLVMAGGIINRLLEEHNVKLYPVDSEHSAIWQCLVGEDMQEIRKIILTGSGGPFRQTPAREFPEITVEQALRHPNWNMGKKITIDSATMANKGLEVIEAYWLFDVPPEAIEIIIHPQSIIHSMVEFVDGSVKAQLGIPDMKVPIQYALTYPNHLEAQWEDLDLSAIQELTFESPDFDKFPSMAYAFQSLESGGTMPAVFNVANESAVYAFLDGKIGFHQIPQLVESAMSTHQIIDHPEIDDIIETEKWTKTYIQHKLDEDFVN